MRQRKSSRRITHREKRINHIIAEAKANHKGDEVNYALNRSLSFDSLFSLTAYIAPINCPFVLYVGTRKLVKRKEFEEYISGKLII